MTDELRPFVTRRMTVEALRLTSDNLGEAVALSDAEMFWSRNKSQFALRITTPRGNITGWAGMWLVKSKKGWVAMTDQNFRNKYEPDEEVSNE